MKLKVIVPARKGSKRLLNKNILKLKNKPLIQYTIELADQVFDTDDIWVNSDCEEIEKICSDLKINFYKRPSTLGLDTTTSVEVLEDQLKIFKKNNITCDVIILLQPTSPFRSPELIKDCFNEFKKSGRKSLATFSPTLKKTGKISENKIFTPINYSPGQRTQDIDSRHFYENGSVYIVKKEAILKEKKIITDDVFPYIFSDAKLSLDIDTYEDFQLAQFYLNQKKNEE